MFISDIYSEAKTILGTCDESVVFKRISDAVRIANHKAKFDIAVGQMDICVCDGCVTLPADVATVLGVNNGGFPTLLRDQWFQYHANGPGTEGFVDWGYTDELGYVTTFRDPHSEVQLIAEVENPQDSNKLLRVFGWDKNGKRIYTEGAGGILEDGFLVPTVYGFSIPNPNAPYIAKIDKIKKDVTNGFVKLLAVDPFDQDVKTTIGYYQPWETVPLYRRIKAPDRSWLRIKYRKKDLEVRSQADWINIENRLALLILLKAVKYRLDNQFDLARTAEDEGIALLSDEAEALRPVAISPPKIIWSEGIPSGPEESLFQGGSFGGRYL